MGRLEELPALVRRELNKTQAATREGSALMLTLALNYGGRREIVDACRALAQKAVAGEIEPDEIDEEQIGSHLYTAGLPDPDLLIRTGGEMRVSNFLLWQISYAEICVTDVLWPDFGKEAFQEALQEYARRERRFGGVKGADRAEARD